MRVPTLTRLRRTVATGIAVALAASASACDFDGAYDLPLPGSPVDADEAYQVTAEFDDVLNIVPRSLVLVDDVTVGEVVEVERAGWNAVVTMRIRDDIDLPDNAIASIRQTSLLGEKYIALEEPARPSARRLADGDRIDLAATGRNPEVEEVLGALSFLLSGGGVGQLSTISRELNLVMTGRTERLRGLLGNLEDVVGTLDDQKADIIRALEAMNRLSRTLNEGSEVIDDALQTMGPAVAVLSEQHDALVDMLESLDRLGRVGTRVIEGSREDMLTTLRSLQPTLRRLNEAGESLPRGLSLLLSFPFPEAAQEIVKGDYANTEIVFDINFENFLADAPEVELPDPGEVLTELERCLASGSLTSRACAAFVGNLDLFGQLRRECRERANRNNPVCRAVNAVPGDDGGEAPLTDLPDLPGLDLGAMLLSPTGARTGTDLYGEGLA